MQYYTAYNLTLGSPIPLPHLHKSSHKKIDVTIRYGDVCETLDNPRCSGILFEATAQQFLLKVDGVARYLVENGDSIIVQPEPGYDETALTTFLLGSVTGALLYQRNIVPFHASAVETPKGAILFSGKGGSGKSTIMNALCRNGFRMLADNICAVSFETVEHAIVYPAYPISRLWQDSIEELGMSLETLQRVSPGMEKFLFPVDNFCNEPRPLHTLYSLSPWNRDYIQIEELKGLDKVYAYRNGIYRKRIKAAYLGSDEDFIREMNMIENTRVVSIHRPSDNICIESLVDNILADCMG